MAMKAADSTIKVGGPAFNNLSQTRMVDESDFWQTPTAISISFHITNAPASIPTTLML
jgi:hypothetical protein